MVAIYCSHFGPPFNATLGFPGEGWRKGRARAGVAPDLVIRTHNVSGWATATEALRTAPAGTQILLLQEVRTRPDQVQARRLQAQHLGWQLHIEPSRPTEAGGWSAGVATAHRPNLRLMGPPAVIWEHRCLVITVHTAEFGPLQIANLYQDVYATDDEKYSQLARIWDRLRSRLGRPIIGGDFNMQPPQVRRWTQAISASVLAPGATTYSTDTADSILDYFVADQVLCMGQAKVEALVDLPCSPHRPTQLTFQGALMDKAVNVYQPPKPGATAPVCGPRRQVQTAKWEEWATRYTRFWAKRGGDTLPEEVPTPFWQEVQMLLDEWVNLAHQECQDLYGMVAAPCAADAAK